MRTVKILQFCIVLVLAAVFIALSAQVALALEAKGATKLKPRPSHPWANIDEIIRAQEDPEYELYLKEKEKQNRVDQAAVEEVKNERAAWEAVLEKQRLQQLRDREKIKPQDYRREYKQHLEERRAWMRQQEAVRKQYVQNRNNREDKVDFERQARLKKVFPNVRMPASVEDEPKYPAGRQPFRINK